MRTQRASVVVALAGLVGLVTACGSFGSATASGTGADGGDAGAEVQAPPPSEDCLDGRDDDGSGKMDCEEPTCAPYVRCAPGPAAFPGWTGYSTLVAGDAPCPADLPVAEDVWAADEGLATCASCKCEAQATCPTSVSVSESAIAGCNQGTLPFTAGTACGLVPALAAAQIANYWSFSTAATASCVATGGGPTTLPTKKYRAARACSGARLGGGCPAGQVCAKLALTGLCISRPAQGARLPCPSEFPVARVGAPKTAAPDVAFSDQRGCSNCSCDAKPTGGGCTGELELYSDTGCGTLKGKAPSQMCAMVSCSGLCKSAKLVTKPTPGTCGSTGGGPHGAVELTVAGTQYCCDR